MQVSYRAVFVLVDVSGAQCSSKRDASFRKQAAHEFARHVTAAVERLLVHLASPPIPSNPVGGEAGASLPIVWGYRIIGSRFAKVTASTWNLLPPGARSVQDFASALKAACENVELGVNLDSHAVARGISETARGVSWPRASVLNLSPESGADVDYNPHLVFVMTPFPTSQATLSGFLVPPEQDGAQRIPLEKLAVLEKGTTLAPHLARALKTAACLNLEVHWIDSASRRDELSDQVDLRCAKILKELLLMQQPPVRSSYLYSLLVDQSVCPFQLTLAAMGILHRKPDMQRADRVQHSGDVCCETAVLSELRDDRLNVQKVSDDDTTANSHGERAAWGSVTILCQRAPLIRVEMQLASFLSSPNFKGFWTSDDASIAHAREYVFSLRCTMTLSDLESSGMLAPAVYKDSAVLRPCSDREPGNFKPSDISDFQAAEFAGIMLGLAQTQAVLIGDLYVLCPTSDSSSSRYLCSIQPITPSSARAIRLSDSCAFDAVAPPAALAPETAVVEPTSTGKRISQKFQDSRTSPASRPDALGYSARVFESHLENLDALHEHSHTLDICKNGSLSSKITAAASKLSCTPWNVISRLHLGCPPNPDCNGLQPELTRMKSEVPTRAPNLDRRKELIQMLMVGNCGLECGPTETDSCSLARITIAQAVVTSHEAVYSEDGYNRRLDDVLDVAIVPASTPKAASTTEYECNLSRVPRHDSKTQEAGHDSIKMPRTDNPVTESLANVDVPMSAPEEATCKGGTSQESRADTSDHLHIKTLIPHESMSPDALNKGIRDHSKDVTCVPVHSLGTHDYQFGYVPIEVNGEKSRDLIKDRTAQSWLADGLERLWNHILSLRTDDNFTVTVLRETTPMLSTLVDFTHDYRPERIVIKQWVKTPSLICNWVRSARECHMRCVKGSPSVQAISESSRKLVVDVLHSYVQVILHILKVVSANKRSSVNVAACVKPAVKILSSIQVAGQNLDDSLSAMLSSMFDIVFTDVLVSCPLHGPWHGLINEIRRQYDRDVSFSATDEAQGQTLKARYNKFLQSNVGGSPNLHDAFFRKSCVERTSEACNNAENLSEPCIVSQNMPGAEGRVLDLPVIASEYQVKSTGKRRQQPEHILRLHSGNLKPRKRAPTAKSRAPSGQLNSCPPHPAAVAMDSVPVLRKSPRRRKPTRKVAAMSIVATATQSLRADPPQAAVSQSVVTVCAPVDGREKSIVDDLERMTSEMPRHVDGREKSSVDDLERMIFEMPLPQ